ncbi:hypothetical protein KC906_00260 [Candidatus Kaiserbacteria bacterium]|nr:hypothetical protein [Candidatus Kaiserbacteria bacterium]
MAKKKRRVPELPENMRFDGSNYVPARDDRRLTGQIRRIYAAMSDGVWRTLEQIHEITGDPQPSISAQLRHLRKERFGGHEVLKRHEGGGLYHYRLVPNNNDVAHRRRRSVKKKVSSSRRPVKKRRIIV